MADEDFTPAEMRRWIERVESSVKDLRDSNDRRFSELQREVQRAAFVPIVLYQAERDAEKDRVNGRLGDIDGRVRSLDDRLESSIASVRRTSWTVAGLVLTGVGVLVGVLKAAGL